MVIRDMSKRSKNSPITRLLLGGGIAFVLAGLMYLSLITFAPNHTLTALAMNSSSPFLMMFSASLVLICLGTLPGYIFQTLGKGEKLSAEQIGMLGMLILSVSVVSWLIYFQECREAVIEFRITQSQKDVNLTSGEVFFAKLGPGVNIQANNVADTNVPPECHWKASTNTVKIYQPNRCQTLVQAKEPGSVILTLDARPPRCTSRILAPVTIVWE